MRKVYVIEPTRVDFLEGLYPFGDVQVVFTENRPSIFSDDFKQAIRDAFHTLGFNAATDYVAIVGKQVPLVIMVAELVAEFGEITVLLFSSSERRYVPRTIGGALCTSQS